MQIFRENRLATIIASIKSKGTEVAPTIWPLPMWTRNLIARSPASGRSTWKTLICWPKSTRIEEGTPIGALTPDWAETTRQLLTGVDWAETTPLLLIGVDWAGSTRPSLTGTLECGGLLSATSSILGWGRDTLSYKTTDLLFHPTLLNLPFSTYSYPTLLNLPFKPSLLDLTIVRRNIICDAFFHLKFNFSISLKESGIF